MVVKTVLSWVHWMVDETEGEMAESLVGEMDEHMVDRMDVC